MSKNTIIISAFPGCGKSSYYKDYSRYSPDNIWRRRKNGEQAYYNINGEISDIPLGQKILDSDSNLFSWIYDENGNKTDKRNPDFPNNYIQHIKDCIDKEDIVFVSSHKSVREALEKEGIHYYLVYPANTESMKMEFMNRFKRRGSDEVFITFQNNHWNEFIEDMTSETFPTKIEMNGKLNTMKQVIEYISMDK